MKIATIGW